MYREDTNFLIKNGVELEIGISHEELVKIEEIYNFDFLKVFVSF